MFLIFKRTLRLVAWWWLIHFVGAKGLLSCLPKVRGRAGVWTHKCPAPPYTHPARDSGSQTHQMARCSEMLRKRWVPCVTHGKIKKVTAFCQRIPRNRGSSVLGICVCWCVFHIALTQKVCCFNLIFFSTSRLTLEESQRIGSTSVDSIRSRKMF